MCGIAWPPTTTRWADPEHHASVHMRGKPYWIPSCGGARISETPIALARSNLRIQANSNGYGKVSDVLLRAYSCGVTLTAPPPSDVHAQAAHHVCALTTALAKLVYWPEERYLTIFGSTNSKTNKLLMDDPQVMTRWTPPGMPFRTTAGCNVSSAKAVLTHSTLLNNSAGGADRRR